MMNEIKRSAKKRIIVWSVVSCILIVALVAGTAVSSSRENLNFIGFKLFGDGSAAFETFDDYSDYNEGGMEFEAAKVKSLDIKWDNGSIDFTNSFDNKVVFSETGNDSKKMYWMLDGNGVLHIRYDSSNGFFSLFSIGSNKEKTLSISIPEKMNFYDITVNCAGADIHAKKLNANHLDINTASGGAEISKLSAKKVNINTASGDFVLGGAISDELDINSVSGGFTVDAAIKKADFNSVSGDLEMHIKDIAESVDSKTVSGDCRITFPKSVTGFETEFESVSGDFSCDFSGKQSGKNFLFGDGHIKVEHESVSGNLTIKPKNQ